VKLRVLEIARVGTRQKTINQEKLKQRYHQLLETRAGWWDRQSAFNEVAEGVKRSADMLQQLALDGLGSNSIRCCRWSVMSCGRPGTASSTGKTRTQGKVLSLFEPATEVIRKGKLRQANQFGNMVKLQEAENQIVMDYEVYNRRPSTRNC